MIGRKSIIAKAKHPRRAAFDRRVPRRTPLKSSCFRPVASITALERRRRRKRKEKKKKKEKEETDNDELHLLLLDTPQKTHTSYKLKAKSLLSNARNALYPAGCKISASLFRWLLARLNTRASTETRDSKKTGHDHGEGKRQPRVHRQKDRLAKGRKGLDARNGLPIVRSPPSFHPTCLPLVAGVFRSCWNAILRIPGRDGKSTGGQFVRTARCRRRRDLKVDTFRVRVRTDVYIFIYVRV